MTKTRIAAYLLSLSAVGFVGIVQQEGWTERAVIPVKGDVPTVGPGLTRREDGSPVQMGDTIKPVEGVRRSLAHIQKDELGVKRCLQAPLTQTEYDMMVDFAYQYGVGTLCKSTMMREANRGNYAASCAGYLLYKKAGGYDCSTPGNKRCSGVWTRSQERYAACMGFA